MFRTFGKYDRRPNPEAVSSIYTEGHRLPVTSDKKHTDGFNPRTGRTKPCCCWW